MQTKQTWKSNETSKTHRCHGKKQQKAAARVHHFLGGNLLPFSGSLTVESTYTPWNDHGSGQSPCLVFGKLMVIRTKGTFSHPRAHDGFRVCLCPIFFHPRSSRSCVPAAHGRCVRSSISGAPRKNPCCTPSKVDLL